MGAGGNILTNRPSSKYNRFILGSGVGAVNLFSRRINKQAVKCCETKNIIYFKK